MNALALALAGLLAQPSEWVVYEGGAGPGKGKHVVLLAGDEEYRSEEGLPQLARILAFRHGFKCTVLFSVNARGEIDPTERRNQPGLEALATADACIMLLRFREWPDGQMRHFADYYLSGKPILALRTSTHAFDFAQGSPSPYRRFGWRSAEWPGGFGRQVLGETWVSHWGEHGVQATRGVAEPGADRHPILRGVQGVFGDSDVYEAAPPADAEILMRGEVVSGLDPDDPPAAGAKRTARGAEQPLNEPMMPVAWLRSHRNEAGKVNAILTCTMGAATDLMSDGLRRMLVNGTYWAVGLEAQIPGRANVDFVGDYKPSKYGFGGFRKGVKPSDLEWGRFDELRWAGIGSANRKRFARPGR